jgi:hypothetical protein
MLRARKHQLLQLLLLLLLRLLLFIVVFVGAVRVSDIPWGVLILNDPV